MKPGIESDDAFLGAALIVLFAMTAAIAYQQTPIHAVNTSASNLVDARTPITNQTPDFPLVYQDEFGSRTQVGQQPKRIISLTLMSDEILCDLVSIDRLLAVTPFASYESASNCAHKVKQLPTLIANQTERMVEFHPDLVVMNRFTDARPYDLSRGAGLSAVRIGDFESLAGIKRSVLSLGAIVGELPKARNIVRQMDSLEDQVQKLVAGRKKPRVLNLNGQYATGTGTLFDELISLAGGQNVASEVGINGFGIFADELLVATDPDVILLVVGDPDNQSTDPRKALFAKPSWQQLSAVRKQRVVLLPSKYLGSISHYVILGLPSLAAALHPDSANELNKLPKQFSVEIP